MNLIRICHRGSIFLTENPMFLGTGFMYLVPMINITDMFFVWEIMCVGQHP